MRGLRGDFRRHVIRGDVLFVQQRPVPQKQLMTFRFTADAQSAQRSETVHLRQFIIAGFFQNRMGQRVAGALFERGSQT